MGFQKLKMNKKGLEFKLAFFALIGFSMIIIALGIWIEEWNTFYGSDLDNDLGGFNKLDDISGQAKDQKDSLSIRSTATGEEFEGTSIRGAFGVLNNLYGSFRIVFGDGGMIESISERFSIPEEFVLALVTIMFVSITFALVAIFFRLARRSA